MLSLNATFWLTGVLAAIGALALFAAFHLFLKDQNAESRRIFWRMLGAMVSVFTAGAALMSAILALLNYLH